MRNKKMNKIDVDSVAVWLITLYAFFIPISTALVNYCILLVLLIWLASGNLKSKLSAYKSYSLAPPIIALLGVFIIGMLYTSAISGQMSSSLRDIFRLCTIPVVSYYLHEKYPEKRKYVLWAFTAAMILTLILSFLKVYTDLPIGTKHHGNGVFKNHIQTSYFMVMAMYFLLVQYYYKNRSYVFIALILTMFYYLFYINTGRTGYIILSSALFVFVIYHFRIKGLVALVLTFSVTSLVAYFTSDVFSIRMNELYNELMCYLNGETISSLGTRMEFATNSISLFKEHPILGYGTSSFGEAYAQTFTGKVRLLTDNPHNEYLRIMVELGCMGLLVLVWLFSKVYKEALKIKEPEYKILALGVFASYMVGCFLNSWINDFAECHFFCLMAASLLTYNSKNKGMNAPTPAPA